MFNKFIANSLKMIISPLVVLNKSHSFSPFYKFKFLNLNIYQEPFLYLYKAQISAISKRNVYVKGRFVWASLLLSFSIPFFGDESTHDEEKSKIVMILKRAVVERQCGEVEKAEQSLHLALKSAQEANNLEAIAFVYDIMANYAFENKDFEKAEIHFVNILKLFLQNGKADDDNDVVEASLKLALVNLYLGNNDKALQAFNFCIGTQENKLKSVGEENVDEDTLELWAMSHDYLARYYLNVDRYDLAKEYFKRAYDVYLKANGQEDPQVAILLNDIGSVCCMQQSYDEAIEYLNKAINLALLSDMKELASFYTNLGTVHLYKKTFEEAEWNCKTAMKIAERHKDDEAVNQSMACLEALKDMKI